MDDSLHTQVVLTTLHLTLSLWTQDPGGHRAGYGPGGPQTFRQEEFILPSRYLIRLYLPPSPPYLRAILF